MTTDDAKATSEEPAVAEAKTVAPHGKGKATKASVEDDDEEDDEGSDDGSFGGSDEDDDDEVMTHQLFLDFLPLLTRLNLISISGDGIFGR